MRRHRAQLRLWFWSCMLRVAAVADRFYWWAYEQHSAACWLAIAELQADDPNSESGRR